MALQIYGLFTSAKDAYLPQQWLSLGGLHQATPPGPGTPPREQTPRDQAPSPRSRAPGPGTPSLLTESQTPVKTLPCPNFVAGGNKQQTSKKIFTFAFAFVRCEWALKGPFTLNDSVTITVTLTGGTFDLFDGHSVSGRMDCIPNLPINVTFVPVTVTESLGVNEP